MRKYLTALGAALLLLLLCAGCAGTPAMTESARTIDWDSFRQYPMMECTAYVPHWYQKGGNGAWASWYDTAAVTQADADAVLRFLQTHLQEPLTPRDLVPFDTGYHKELARLLFYPAGSEAPHSDYWSITVYSPDARQQAQTYAAKMLARNPEWEPLPDRTFDWVCLSHYTGQTQEQDTWYFALTQADCLYLYEELARLAGQSFSADDARARLHAALEADTGADGSSASLYFFGRRYDETGRLTVIFGQPDDTKSGWRYYALYEDGSYTTAP